METVGIVLGTILIGLFICSNLYLDGFWASLTPARADPFGLRGSRGAIRGAIEAILFMTGVALVTASVAAVGISLGYGGF